MLGGGTFITQNKVMPGTYMNFVSAARASATLSDRGSDSGGNTPQFQGIPLASTSGKRLITLSGKVLTARRGA